MRNIKLITCISLLFFFVQLTFAQSPLNVDLYKFGCLDKVIMPERSATQYVYTGDDPNVEVEIVEILISEASSEWQKKKSDKNCLSSDPNDCMVWCMVEIPEVKETYKILEDTLVTDDWEVKSIQQFKGGEKVKLPVLCKEEISRELLEEIKQKLISKSFELSTDKKYKKLNGKLRKSLKDFQSRYGLAIGDLTRETIHELSKL